MLVKTCRGLLFLGVLTSLAGGAKASEEYWTYFGVAAAQRSGQLLYGESHVLHYHDDQLAERVVLYTCPDGTPFARKSSAYANLLAPDFLFEDRTNGVREGVRAGDRPGSPRTVFFRGPDGKSEKSAPLPVLTDLVIDSGFDEFVRRNWGALLSTGSVPLQFLVPSRLEAMSFQLQHVRKGMEDGVPTEVFRLKPQGIVGWIAPSIDVSYSEREHLLVRYEGMSNLRDKGGENLRIDITFRLSDRKPTDAGAAAAALHATLLACR
jgi:hypothetical protein